MGLIRIKFANRAAWKKRAGKNFFLNFINEQAEKWASRVEKKSENHKRAGSFIRDCRVLRKTESALERERNNDKANSEQQPNAVLRLQSDLSKLKTKCNTYEKENFELRRLLGGDRTPKYLPISSPTQHSPSPSSSTPETEYVPSVIASPHATHGANTSGDVDPRTPKQSFKKIFGKIKRSNSGGHLQENGNKVQQQQQHQQQQTPKISMVEDTGQQTFR